MEKNREQKNRQKNREREKSENKKERGGFLWSVLRTDFGPFVPSISFV